MRFETWCWRRMLKIKWAYRITNDEVYQSAKEERLLLKILKNRCHSWMGHTIGHNKFSKHPWRSNIHKKKGCGKTLSTILKASRQKYRSWKLCNEKNGLQQFQLESCQLIKRLKDKKNKYMQTKFTGACFFCWHWHLYLCIWHFHHVVFALTPGTLYELCVSPLAVASFPFFHPSYSLHVILWSLFLCMVCGHILHIYRAAPVC
jgi:hypothetical protein